MKTKINRRIAVAFMMSFVIYMLFGQVTQLLSLQRQVVQKSDIIIGQLARIVKLENLADLQDDSKWERILSLAELDDDSMMLIADAQTGNVLGATSKQLVGKTLEQLGCSRAEYEKHGAGMHITIDHATYYGVFYEYEDLLYGYMKSQRTIYQPLRAPTIMMPFIVVVFLLVLSISIARYANDHIARPLTQLGEAIRRLADGEKDVSFSVSRTDFDEIRQMGSCLNQIQDSLMNQQAQLEEHRQLLAMESERADAAIAAKKVFLSRMSHDIRTPMNGIIGMTAIAETYIDDQNRVRDALAKIDASSKQLLAMLNDVLDMSQIESGRLDLTEENFQLAELINRTIAELRPAAEARNHQLIVDVKRLVHEYVVGSPQRVRAIFMNIIENSVKYTPKGGMIRVTITELPSEIRYAGRYSFVFEDNGIGMTQETIARIFEPFERVSDDERTGAIRGMGLGLPIVKNIVELMNGSIQVESEPETGSKFSVTISLKLQKRAEGVATRMVKNEIRVEDFCNEKYSDKRVLVVEDHELSSEVASEVLGMAGIAAEAVSNGQQAVLRMTEVPEGYFDLILMDIQMPVMDGYIATRMIRNMKRDDVKRLPIVAMTALSSGEDIETAKRAGMDDYIVKPLSLERLKEVFMKWM